MVLTCLLALLLLSPSVDSIGCLPFPAERVLAACTFWAPAALRTVAIFGHPPPGCAFPPGWQVVLAPTRNATVVVFATKGAIDTVIVQQARPTIVFAHSSHQRQLHQLDYLPTSAAGGLHMFLREEQKHWQLPSLSQEDLYAYLAFFHTMPQPGVFLELGGADGVAQSNTLFFEKQLGWTGFLVEANNAQLQKARARRPQSALVNAAVCQQARRVHWLGHDLTAGIVEFMSPVFLRRLHHRRWPALRAALGLARDHQPANVTQLDHLPWLHPVQCAPLTDLLPALRHVDFFSLDVEGAELQVVNSINFKQLSIGVMVVEADGRNATKDAEVRRVLLANGLRFVRKYAQNDWFRGD